ncbi:MAG: cytochrome b N-terminal domain-containing protein [Chloroflexota bacterium]
MRLWRKEKSLLYALHPARIPAAGARFTYTFGLGGLALLAAVVTALSGLALTLYYVPTPAEAHDSLVLVADVVAFGAIARGLHFWAAQLMVVAATLHLARVAFTSAYRPPREFNWLVGLALLVLTIVWDFSGYVLRWDDGAHWALLIGTNLVREVPLLGEGLYRALVGDTQIGASALLRFYAWHVVGLTLAGAVGIVYHLWRVRRDGGISQPPSASTAPRAFVSRDHLFTSEGIATALAGALLLLLAAFAPVALGPAADLRAGLADRVQAPWVFLWVQSLLRFLPPLWAGVLLPLGVLALLASLPFWNRRATGRASWFSPAGRGEQVALACLALVLIGLSLAEVLR